MSSTYEKVDKTEEDPKQGAGKDVNWKEALDDVGSADESVRELPSLTSASPSPFPTPYRY